MRKLIRRLALTLLIALVPALFCALMTAPLSFALPLSCPEGSKVIGIECFDSRGNNFTPWYRRELNPAFASFPLWLVAALVVAWSLTGSRMQATDSQEYVPSSTPRAAVPQPLTVVLAEKPDPDADKRWLPTQCPQCGGALAINEVQWISSFEARCPYCGSVLKA
jgi:hypothetical protein